MNPPNLLPKDGEVYFYPEVFTIGESENYFNDLRQEVIWSHEPVVLFGKEILQPRLTAWFGEAGKDLTYSGTKMKPQPWSPTLLEIKRRIQTLAQVQFSGALLNLYRSGKDSVGWHRDNEKQLGENPVIASVSFGQTRPFHFKHAVEKDLKVQIELTSGSLLIMQGETQKNWFHAIAKTAKPIGARINITFRKL